MLLSAFPPQNPLSNPTPPPHHPPTLLFSPATFYKAAAPTTLHASSQRLPPLTLTNAAATSSTTLRQVSGTCSDNESSDGEGDGMVTSASAVAAAIRNASTSPVDFVQTIEKDDGKNRGLVLPSVDFQRLCHEQLELFRRIVHPDSLLSVRNVLLSCLIERTFLYYKLVSLEDALCLCLLLLVILLWIMNLSDSYLQYETLLAFLLLTTCVGVKIILCNMCCVSPYY